jgi:hypothetical protein
MHSLLSCAAGPAITVCPSPVTVQPGAAAGAGASQSVTPAPGSGSLFGYIAQAFASAAEGLLKTLAASWMNVGTPQMDGTGTPAWVIAQDTKWVVTLVAVGCILVAAARLAIRRRGEPVGAMLLGLVRLVFVTASATFIVQQAGAFGDEWSSALMNSAHLGASGWSGAISVTVLAGALGGGDAVLLIVSLLLVLSVLIQLMLMVLRVGLLVVLTGTLPLAAAASMCDWGESWWRKHIGWLVAWLLYKPAAALLYVGAFALTGSSSLTEVLAGWMLLILSVLILPSLLRLVVPLTAALGAASAGGLAMAATGAAAGAVAGRGGPLGMAATLAGRLGHGPSSSPSAAGEGPEPDGDNGLPGSGSPSGAGAVTTAFGGRGGFPAAPAWAVPRSRGSAPGAAGQGTAGNAPSLPQPSGAQEPAAPGQGPAGHTPAEPGGADPAPVTAPAEAPATPARQAAEPGGADPAVPPPAPSAPHVPGARGAGRGADGERPSGAADGDDNWTVGNRGTTE